MLLEIDYVEDFLFACFVRECFYHTTIPFALLRGKVRLLAFAIIPFTALVTGILIDLKTGTLFYGFVFPAVTSLLSMIVFQRYIATDGVKNRTGEPNE